jgi:pilus assembly protein Flp/PilA
VARQLLCKTLPEGNMHVSVKKFLLDENGQDMVEYALVMGLIAVACVATVNGLATSIATGFGSVGNKVTSYTS